MYNLWATFSDLSRSGRFDYMNVKVDVKAPSPMFFKLEEPLAYFSSASEAVYYTLKRLLYDVWFISVLLKFSIDLC